MKTSDCSFHQCFNGQAIVDSVAQVIVAADVSTQAPDAHQLAPALGQLAENLAAIDAQLPDRAVLTADAGYFSEENIRITTGHRLDAHIATGRFKHTEAPASARRGPIPKNASAKQRMARKLATNKGHATYARRKMIVDPVFGQLQTVQDARQLLLRGEPAGRAQWRFQCTIHNPSNSTAMAAWRSSRPDRSPPASAHIPQPLSTRSELSGRTPRERPANPRTPPSATTGPHQLQNR
jgi:Transposase DDE domain